MAEYEAGMKSLSDGVNAYVAGGNQLAGGVQSSDHTMFQTVVVNTILCHITAHIVGNRF